MKKQTVLAKKRRGPPPTGKGVQIVVRMQPSPLASLDAWAAKQDDRPTRAEAIRRLIELGLTGEPQGRAKSQGQKHRAREMAGGTIDELTDTSANVDDQANRKRRLIKGPEEFRNVRVDRPGRKT